MQEGADSWEEHNVTASGSLSRAGQLLKATASSVLTSELFHSGRYANLLTHCSGQGGNGAATGSLNTQK